MLTRLRLFDQKYYKNSKNRKYYNLNNIFYFNVMYSCGGKAEFSASITPVFRVLLIFERKIYSFIKVENLYTA